MHVDLVLYNAWPQLRWSLSHIDELMPTKNVWRGSGPSRELPRRLQEIKDEKIETLGGEALSWDEALEKSYTDGLLVLHKGEVVYEEYYGACSAHIRHIIQSANKSLVGILAESLIYEGKLDANALVPSIIPELIDSAYADATVQQVLDMLISMDFYEDYLDPKSEIWRFHRATGMSPSPNVNEFELITDVLANVGKAGKHGEEFAYHEPNIFVLGWIIRRAGGQDIRTQLSERIWQHIGAEYDGYYIMDPGGAESSSGFTLRDFVRFGELVRTGGKIEGKQIIPSAVIEKVMAGGNQDLFAKAGHKTLPGWSYKSQWWMRHVEDRICAVARGAHGQVLYVDPSNELVVGRFGSAPNAPSTQTDDIFLPMLDVITARLS
ncbi:MAG: CubicO group peptidase (beta-lactamase class C family) [Candidatus Azotimanducaceae bacterium]|jgi:CubicO group peptidase (beta-lactamase class C family)